MFSLAVSSSGVSSVRVTLSGSVMRVSTSERVYPHAASWSRYWRVTWSGLRQLFLSVAASRAPSATASSAMSGPVGVAWVIAAMGFGCP